MISLVTIVVLLFVTRSLILPLLAALLNLLTLSATFGFVYYATYEDQRAINRLFELHFERDTSSLRPYVDASYNYARERSGPEIDARVLRHETSVTIGSDLVLTGITSLTGFYRRSTLDYGDDQYLGTPLADQLDREAEIVSGGLKYAITPLTTRVSLRSAGSTS